MLSIEITFPRIAPFSWKVMGEVRPASTLVICDLVHPAMLVEIEIEPRRTS